MLIQGRTAALSLIAASFIILFPSSSALQAESKLNFPRLSAEENTFTGIAIVNPSDTDAVVTFTAYGADGQLVPGALVPDPVTIKAGEQLPPKLTSDLFGPDLDPETVGWFQATSPTDDLVGFFLFLNNPTTVFDGADVPASFDKLVFAQIRIDSDYTTELNIINPNATAAVLELKLLGGASGATRALSIPAMGASRLDVQDFFGVAIPSSSDQYVTVTSDVQVAGFEFVRAPTGDLVGLGARDGNEQLTQLYFPQVAVFGGFETSVGVVNNLSAAVLLDINFFDPSGVLLADATASLDPGGILVEDLSTLLPSLTGPDLLQGWLKVESSLPAITGFLTYAIPATGSAATVTPSSVGLSEVIFSHLATDLGFFTGLALLNPGQLAANIRVLAMEETGSAVILGSSSTLLRPGERISKLITDFAEDAQDKVKGFVFVRSNLPIYSSSLFGSANVLANIPPQLSPTSFAPDAGLDPVTVTPPVAIVQPSATQSFQVQGVTGEVTWLVNDVEGGNATVGSIDDSGQYTAPAQVPLPRVVTITASAQGGLQKGGSSVDVLEKEQVFASTEFVVQSVAYLGSLQNLYTAELAILSSSGNGSTPQATTPSQISNNSEIFEIVGGNVRTSIKNFDDEKITKIIPFTATNSTEFLLMTAQTSGKVIRLDPVTKTAVDIATGLNQPSSLVIDTSTGNLLVAEQDKVTIIAKTLLESDLLASRVPGPSGPQAVTFPLGGDGLARDRCTGDIYTTDATAGVIRRFDAETQQVSIVFSDLQGPGQLLALYRTGISCPHSLQILLVEVGASRLTLLTPAQDLLVPWAPDIDSTDVAFLPGDSPFASTSAILLSELFDAEQPQAGEGGSGLSFFSTPGLYGDPDNEPTGGDTIPIIFADSGLEACAQSALNLSPTQFVTQGAARTVTQLNCSSRQIALLDGLEFFPKLTEFVAQDNLINADEPLAQLSKLTKLDLRNNKFGSARLDIVARLVGLTELDVCGQLFASPFGDVAGIDSLDFLTNLVNLEVLTLCGFDASKRGIDDITILSGFEQLRELDLENNRVADITPLVDNPGLGEGDTVNLKVNNLDTSDCADINTLTGRGVTVEHDLTCP